MALKVKLVNFVKLVKFLLVISSSGFLQSVSFVVKYLGFCTRKAKENFHLVYFDYNFVSNISSIRRSRAIYTRKNKTRLT